MCVLEERRARDEFHVVAVDSSAPVHDGEGFAHLVCEVVDVAVEVFKSIEIEGGVADGEFLVGWCGWGGSGG